MALTEKLETRAPHRVAPLEALDTLILEADAPQAVRDDLAQGGARIILA
jgi:DeoR/GlpR family transcriptional regulator of sugar metabolism